MVLSKILKRLIMLLCICLLISIIIIVCIKQKNEKDNPKDTNQISNTTILDNNTVTIKDIPADNNTSSPKIETKVDQEITDPWQEEAPILEENLKLKSVTDTYSYFVLKQCITQFYSSKKIAQALLPEELKNIDISQFYGRIEEPSFCIDAIYRAEVNLGKHIYVVYYRLEVENSSYINLCSIVKIDRKNLNFTIYPFEYLKAKGISELKENDSISLDIIKINDIDRNAYNHYKEGEIKTTDVACVREIYERSQFDYNFDTKHLYNLLNEEYRNAKFVNYENFKEYLKYSDVFKGNVDRYQKNDMNDYVQYIALGSFENYYIINYTNILNYNMIIDSYSIVFNQYLEVYNSSFPTVQGKYCMDRVKRALNDKNYKFIYEKLDLVYRNNNYVDYNDFVNFIKQNFYEKNAFEYLDYKKLSSKVYEYKVKITDSTGKNFSYRQVNMTVTLKDDADFVISITK